MPRWLLPVLVVYIVMSVITAGAYIYDKRCAKLGRRRIPEATLFGCCLLGGWPGGFVAGRMIRHKTRKASYRVVFALIVALHLAAWGVVAWSLIQKSID